MRSKPAPWFWMRACLLALALLVAPPAVLAQDATWLPSPGSGDFNDNGNWSPTSVPIGTAFFGFSNAVNLATSDNTTLQGFTFNVGASAYTLTNDFDLAFTGVGIAINGGSLVLINDWGTTEFSGTSTAGSATIYNNSDLLFTGSSNAGTATIFNSCCLTFSGSSSAGSATITNDYNLEFLDSSTAGNANIANTFNGMISFAGNSSAGSATIGNAGLIEFGDTSTAGNATILNTAFGGVAFYGSSSAGSAVIVNNGMLVFLENSSAGTATITNNDSLAFAGFSTAGNATIINNCCLVFAENSTAGAAIIFNFNNMEFEDSASAGNATITTQNGASTYFLDNSSGGSARFVVNAGGLLDFSGLATTGTTAGSIEGGGTIALGNKQLTVGSLNTSTLFSGVIAGVGGSLIKVGTGSLTLSGANTYSGPTIVDAGMLIVNGSITSDVTVNAGGDLGGTGQVGSLTLNSGATHSPGNSIGTQTINGNYTNFGTLVIEANVAGQSDRVIVNGGVNITGAALRVLEAAGLYGPTQSYLIIQNNGAAAVVGNFNTITNTIPYLIATVTTTGGDGNDVILTLTRNDGLLTNAASTPNQRAVAGALRNGFASEAGSAGAALINALLMLSPGDTRRALDAMSGEIHASLVHVLFAQSRYITAMASDRLWETGLGGGAAWAGGDRQQMLNLGLAPPQLGERMGLGYAERDAGTGPPSRVSTWVRGYGGIGSIDGDGNADTLRSRGSGLFAGWDMPLAPGLVAGMMGGWGTSEADVDGRRSSADIDSGHAGAYARAALGNVLLTGVASYSHYDIDVTRHIAFPGFAGTATSSYGADQATLYGEAGWRLRVGSLDVMPWTGLAWSQARVQGFAEEGAGVVDLLSDGATYRMLDAIAGIRFGTSFAHAGLTWMPQARIAWTHSFGDIDPRLDLAFRNGGAFVVAGVRREPDALALGAGLNVFDAGAVSGFIDYTAILSDGARDHTATAGLRVRF
ncbi:MAG TPA: autotransporter domain-containing protein [Hyphomicrobiaceae bacterium]